MTINVIVVDDHEIVRAGVIKLLSEFSEILVIGEASTGESAIQLVKEKHPHVVLMDIQMPGIGGLEATKKILQCSPAIKIIILTASTEEPLLSSILKIGATGYLNKQTNADELLLAISTVYAGKKYLCSEIAQHLALKVIDGTKLRIDKLSGKELQIIMMVAKGQTANIIGSLLFLSPKTVNSYRYRIFKKFGLKSDVELTHFAVQYGIVEANITA